MPVFWESNQYLSKVGQMMCKKLKSCKRMHQCHEIGDMMLQSANDDEITVKNLLGGLLAKFIDLAANDYG